MIGTQKRTRHVKESRPVLGVRVFKGTKTHPEPAYREYAFKLRTWNLTDPPSVRDPADWRRGFWAFAPTTGWRNRIADIWESTMIGVVELKGQVVVHQDGYRAQELRILKLWRRPKSERTLTAVTRFLAKTKKR